MSEEAPKPNKTISVFSSSENAIAQSYKDVAAEIGVFLGKEGFNLITGGGMFGLMSCVANGFLSVDGHKDFQRVVPDNVKEFGMEVTHSHSKSFILVDTFHIRLDTFYSLSDGIVVLPGRNCYLKFTLFFSFLYYW
jgi:uncharacterized protein (TIGR00730 family)